MQLNRMKLKYKYYAFDIDGTIVDTEKTGVLSLQKTIRDLMGLELPYDEVYKYFGIPSRKVGGMLRYPREEEFAHTWEQNFIDMRYMMKAFPGVVELLAGLKTAGARMGVVTSRSRFEVENDPIFQQMKEFFEVIISAEDTVKHKPEPEPMLAFIAHMESLTGESVTKEECLYLGDTIHDCGTAHSAGCDFALADWKNKGTQGIPAEYRFTSADELKTILQQ